MKHYLDILDPNISDNLMHTHKLERLAAKFEELGFIFGRTDSKEMMSDLSDAYHGNNYPSEENMVLSVKNARYVLKFIIEFIEWIDPLGIERVPTIKLSKSDVF